MGRRDGELGSCRLQPASSLQHSTRTRTCTVLYCTVDMPGRGRCEASSRVPYTYRYSTGTVPIVYSRYSTVLCSCFRMKFGKTGYFVALLRFGLNLV